MVWIKKGRIILPQKDLWWMQSHAMLPTVDHVKEDLFRIYISGRDNVNRSQIGYVLAQINDGHINILEYSKDPILTIGERGCFDDNGVTPSWIVDNNNKKYLYYIGWNSGTTTIRMSLIAGLAISKDKGKTFTRNSRAPLFDRTDKEPFTIMTAPSVIKETDCWKIWYVSCDGWADKNLPKYNIKYADSQDGLHWKREGHICIDFQSENETALARPCVLKENEKYKMWFSYKDPAIGYRIGYAESFNGKDWERDDSNAGIDVSKEGWDNEMIEYAFVFVHKGIKYMLYNGNNYGANGAGYAVEE
ncbi:MAG: hypothetical protein K8S00_03645 [Bacteroidales bacterium]|nr:hypothetical protein [Bacteroidales bacterium]